MNSIDSTPTVPRITSRDPPGRLQPVAGTADAAVASSAALDAGFMPVVRRPAIVMARGEGSYIWDEAGRRYLDFLQGWAVNALGHGAPELMAALAEQSSLLLTPSPAYHNRPAIELVRLLVRLTGAAQVALLNSGAEANEAAIKLCRKWGRRHKGGAFGIVSTADAFHGRTLAAMAASGKPGWDALFPPYPPGFVKVPFGDLEAMDRAIDASTVALLVEPIQGEAGVVVPPAGYLRGLRELADRHDLLLILDEVQTGVGRTGRFLAQEHEGVRADITTLGKGLGAGLPVSALLANERAACFELGDNGSTHGGNPLMAHVALAVCRVISDPAFLTNVRERGAELAAALAGLAAQWGGARTRGVGLLAALVLDEPIADRLVELSREEGLLCNAARPKVMRFMPQLRVTTAEIRDMAARLERARARLATLSPNPPAARRDEPPR
ncbi:MAG TPA: aminotransferase class III-fold pyridoxal phosphate-dependent enzyme [Polyangiaceae bacterium]|jgi:acetylornithine/N-succinyldiaminopimelate aminotransferase|nr:aminotransferase class III-fold pyridoxal phosphate-dependent enzyme [Polyangiaceae bacterium]